MADVPSSYHRATTLPEQLAVTTRVWMALVLRESKTRFGRNRFGFVWALVEPLVYVGGFLMLRSFLQESIPFGQDLALFLVTGLLAVRMFLAIASRGLGAIVSNLALIAYPPVKPLDVIVARVILETLTMYVIWTISLTLLSMLVEGKIIANHTRFLAAMASLTFLALSVATFNGVVAVLWPAWERIWGMIRLPLLLLSGVFFVPLAMPPAMQAVLWWIPTLHAIEWLRTGIYMTYEPMLSIPYLLGFSAVTLCTALVLERVYRYRMYS
jgi:capsular polysaccharide transport system permease protein